MNVNDFLQSPAGGLALGGVSSALNFANQLHQQSFARREASKQRAFAEKMMNAQMAYNSPVNQVAMMRGAGLNIMGDSVSPMSSTPTQGVAATPPNTSLDFASAFGNVGSGLSALSKARQTDVERQQAIDIFDLRASELEMSNVEKSISLNWLDRMLSAGVRLNEASIQKIVEDIDLSWRSFEQGVKQFNASLTEQKREFDLENAMKELVAMIGRDGLIAAASIPVHENARQFDTYWNDWDIKQSRKYSQMSEKATWEQLINGVLQGSDENSPLNRFIRRWGIDKVLSVFSSAAGAFVGAKLGR